MYSDFYVSKARAYYPLPSPFTRTQIVAPQSPSQLDDKGYFRFSNNIHLELPSLLLQVSRGVLKEFTRM
jgi:hypothetical protein